MGSARSTTFFCIALGGLAVSSCCKKDDPIAVPSEPSFADTDASVLSAPLDSDAAATQPESAVPASTTPVLSTPPRDGGARTSDAGVTPIPTPSFPTPALPSGLPIPSKWPPIPTVLPSGLTPPTPSK